MPYFKGWGQYNCLMKKFPQQFILRLLHRLRSHAFYLWAISPNTRSHLPIYICPYRVSSLGRTLLDKYHRLQNSTLLSHFLLHPAIILHRRRLKSWRSFLFLILYRYSIFQRTHLHFDKYMFQFHAFCLLGTSRYINLLGQMRMCHFLKVHHYSIALNICPHFSCWLFLCLA